MTYNIFDRVAPAMPKPSKGTEIIKLLLSQASKEMREPLLPMSMPALAAHLSEVEFMYSDNKYYELCGQMAHLIAVSGPRRLSSRSSRVRLTARKNTVRAPKTPIVAATPEP